MEKLKKNAKEKIKVSVEEFKGHRFIDLRVYYEDLKTNEFKPTRKGIAIPPDISKDIIKMLNQANEKIISEN